ncbi:glycine betaine/proline transport system permease protein [Pseudorhodobacter antarcticus]|jgi:glycine betaine/proline transport system permease protein|uniref:Glycine betaine/proline transport system permease protein n=1 Tax=Pseudorhodobacter antarcticus TaxID=1077947 RepID=A0A1H8I820_9RHOB|nr:choline ABC transporter permease subunit [Pseudorhodobacter antarcticus]SEN64315.1 glycine betaine/proline transport system permease protein [Pseudorhodobacter antarcticus]
MSAITDQITAAKIPVGDAAETAVTWLQINAGWLFDTISDALNALIDGVTFSIESIGPIGMTILFTALTYALQRSVKRCLIVALGMLFIINQGYWDRTIETLSLILVSCIVCMGAGVPLGIATARRKWLYTVVEPVLDLMQTLPPFVYLIPAVIFFGLGQVPGLIATVIFALPASIRLTHLGISSTPMALTEAATAFGATPMQRLVKVELPSAFPQIMVGLNQTIMLSLSMVVIATLVGAGGLGQPVLNGLNRMQPDLGFESGFVIVALATILRVMLEVRKA